ncbi:hypothetical protein V5O48_012287 [Marasmius crinis-equi]|uniref:Aminoglycoside phosphotransferase domain-containing protein n=1 Tax=Marasmius crinis-equi TaxID=585013 RepID=A0ABR3F3I8_9AGAR
MPFVLSFPPKHGRKPMSIPDTTQFSGVTLALFGVPCATPDEPLYVGPHNELYLLRLNVPENLRTSVPNRVLARVSRDDKTKSDISLESEIATMVFVKSRTKIPVPTVYGYCSTRENAIGQPFSILSFTEGKDMSGPAWENLPTQVKLNAIRDYAHVVLELYRLRFDRIASIYFKKGASPPHCYELGEVAWWKHESAARRARCESYDRGPWKSSGDWVRAALTDEIQSMQRLPEVIRDAYSGSFDGDDSSKWRTAQRTLPEMQKRVEDVIEDGLDRFCAGPFVLYHMDLTPRNIIIGTEGPHAGRIVSVIDWEMAMTAPIWSLVCYPSWFERFGSPNSKPRDPLEAQLFKDTYLREIQRNIEGSESDILMVIQNARAERRKGFADVALLPWPRVDAMLAWMDHNPPRV